MKALRRLRARHEAEVVPAPDLTALRRLDRDLSVSPSPSCLHCGARFRDFGRLDTHLRFECVVLGRVPA